MILGKQLYDDWGEPLFGGLEDHINYKLIDNIGSLLVAWDWDAFDSVREELKESLDKNLSIRKYHD